ncbi:MAG: DNA-3-methyladenine glycosylase [Saprospiraceae bacterium]|nr:DNA-3-methyladenine glycosylase [Saprospiraceae bacterium]
MQLGKDFYRRDDVVQIAKDLLGKFLITEFDGRRTVGKIVETEAYRAPEDKASHAYGYRRTPRTEVMYATGGTAYVYLIYGMYHLFNVVTNEQDIPHAVLIRAVEPVENVELMLLRRGMETLKPQLTAGPGVLSIAMGITTNHSGINLLKKESPIRIEDRGLRVETDEMIAGPRVGVESSQEWASIPWRFRVKDSIWTSKAK